MKKLIALSLIALSLSASAFTLKQTTAQINEEVKVLLIAGNTPKAILKLAKTAGLDSGLVQAALIVNGVDPTIVTEASASGNSDIQPLQVNTFNQSRVPSSSGARNSVSGS